MQPATILRLGILGLPMAGVVLAATTWARGAWRPPSDLGFDAWVASSGYSAWSSASLNATVWMAFGVLALAAAVAPRAPRGLLAWGTFLSVLGLMVLVVPMAMYRIVWPLGSEVAAAAQATTTYRVWLAFSAASFLPGIALVGVSAWRAGWPWWPGAALAAGAVAAWAPWFAVEVVGTFALAVGGVGVAWLVWRPS